MTAPALMSHVIERSTTVEKRSRIGKNEVSGLGKLYLHGGAGLKRDDLELTNSEYSVFAKLAWFGLARREQEQRWSITDLGIAFIEGRARVQSVAVTVDREFDRLEGELVRAGDVNQEFYYEAVAA
ncbi:hypothetical protein SEA_BARTHOLOMEWSD_68 [Streptomyces phage BartholomewSD]|uniref:Uncharacterized protein n=1 Tax=Streptomyces phage Alvy TaxID=2599888 RepID=A0A5J6TR71_9CAUD|nr:hypothetical protein KGG89_gp26 [Streptomyces phage Alvy]QAX95517.1 hypothetical protein SEA_BARTHOLOMEWSD_68 [Streptomyces phage BartholomewSD]QFG12477.1 hypothetical protein SEA_ALVY_68 [Streptomyces phage Alvy]